MAVPPDDDIRDQEFHHLVSWLVEVEATHAGASLTDLACWVMVDRFGVPKKVVGNFVRKSPRVLNIPSSMTWSRRLAKFRAPEDGARPPVDPATVSDRILDLLLRVLGGVSQYSLLDASADRREELADLVQHHLALGGRRFPGRSRDFDSWRAVHIGNRIKVGTASPDAIADFEGLVEDLGGDSGLPPAVRVPMKILALSVRPAGRVTPEAWQAVERELRELPQPDPLLQAIALEGARGWREARDYLEDRVDTSRPLKWSLAIRLAEYAALGGHPRQSEAYLKPLRQGRPPAAYISYMEALSTFNRNHWFDAGYDEAEVPRRRDFLRTL